MNKELRRIEQISIIEQRKKKLATGMIGSELVTRINEGLKYEATVDDIPTTGDDILKDVGKALRSRLRARRKQYREALEKSGQPLPERLVLPGAAYTTEEEIKDDDVLSEEEEDDEEEEWEDEEEEEEDDDAEDLEEEDEEEEYEEEEEEDDDDDELEEEDDGDEG